MAGLLHAQNDSTLLLAPERLTEQDIMFKERNSREVMTTTGTGSGTPENPAYLPYSTWVITSEDILRYGFVTLVDVLKAAPGIRVSQPGNALEGETFLMRGQVGNQFVKIMINGVPIKPSVAVGMPIGAQIPIRQADRIEVMYGPASVSYGGEACVGVVNIIMKETERPIFTQADLSFGSQGYSNLDLSFGGKLLSGKNIIRFSIFGSSTVRRGTDVYDLNPELYRLDQYRPIGLTPEQVYDRNPNFINNSYSLSDVPILSQLSHESRLLGVGASWRGLQVSYLQMNRRDMSCLGFNPLARSYTNSGDELSERISMFTANYQKKWGRLQTNNTVSFNDYTIFGTSSTTFIFDQYNEALYLANRPQTLSEQGVDSVINQVNFPLLSSGQRYASAFSGDVRIESRNHARIWRQLWAESTGMVAFLVGSPYQNRYRVPIAIGSSIDDPLFSPFGYNLTTEVDASLSGQLAWHGSKFRGLAGVSVNRGAGINLRLGASYVLDTMFTFYANYATGHKWVNFHEASNSNISDEGGGAYFFSLSPAFNTAQTFNNFEAGVRVGETAYFSEVSFFSQRSYDLIRAGTMEIIELPTQSYYDRVRVGYKQLPGWGQRIWGIQSRLVLQAEQNTTSKGRTSERRIRWRGECFVQYTRGRERWSGTGALTDAPFNTPRWLVQMRSSGRAGRFQLTTTYTRQSSVLSKQILHASSRPRVGGALTYPAFGSWDIKISSYLNKNFALYAMCTNLFNIDAYGLDATGSSDDLAMPIQQGRQFRAGVSYSMN
jgi:TonB-dependent Receptor Plug Domain